MLARAEQRGRVPSYAGSERAAGQRTPGVQRADQPAARRRGCDAPLASRLSIGLTAPLTVTAAIASLHRRTIGRYAISTPSIVPAPETGSSGRAADSPAKEYRNQ